MILRWNALPGCHPPIKLVRNACYRWPFGEGNVSRSDSSPRTMECLDCADDKVGQTRDLDKGRLAAPTEEPAAVGARVDTRPTEVTRGMSYRELRHLPRVPRRSRPRRLVYNSVRPDPRLRVMTSKQATSPSATYDAVISGGSTYVSMLKVPLRQTKSCMMDQKEKVISLSQHEGWGNFEFSDDDIDTGVSQMGAKNCLVP